jgi:hypothetical protein
VEIIGAAAFSSCKKLEKLNLSDQTYEYGEQAFAYCHSLESVTIPAGPAVIDANAFAFCNKLVSVTLGGMKTLCFGAFAGCPKLTEVVIQEPVELQGERIFQGCPGLADEDGFVIIRGILYDYYGGAAEVTIPDHVIYIDEGAFRDQKQLVKVNIPDSVEGIANCAFEGCEKLVDENGFTIVWDAIFGYWGGASEITVPDGVTAISKQAFAFKENLEHIHIPERVSFIGEGAFDGCFDLTIHAPADSYAAQYAEENWIKWVAEENP